MSLRGRAAFCSQLVSATAGGPRAPSLSPCGPRMPLRVPDAPACPGHCCGPKMPLRAPDAPACPGHCCGPRMPVCPRRPCVPRTPRVSGMPLCARDTPECPGQAGWGSLLACIGEQGAAEEHPQDHSGQGLFPPWRGNGPHTSSSGTRPLTGALQPPAFSSGPSLGGLEMWIQAWEAVAPGSVAGALGNCLGRALSGKRLASHAIKCSC